MPASLALLQFTTAHFLSVSMVATAVASASMGSATAMLAAVKAAATAVLAAVEATAMELTATMEGIAAAEAISAMEFSASIRGEVTAPETAITATETVVLATETAITAAKSTIFATEAAIPSAAVMSPTIAVESAAESVIPIATVEPRVRVIPVIPGACADEYTVYEPVRSPIAIRRAVIGVSGIKPVRAHRRPSFVIVGRSVTRANLNSETHLGVGINCRNG